MKVERYRNGLRDGDAEEYCPNGALYCVTPYKNGRIDGVQRYYQDTGDLAAEATYVQGERQSARVLQQRDGRARP